MFEVGLDLIRSLVGGRTRPDDETGAVSTEYGLVLFFIAVVIIAAVIAFGLALNDLYEQAPSSFSVS